LKKILITGAGGFVGGHLLARARQNWLVEATFHTRPLSHVDIAAHECDLSSESSIVHLIEKVQPDVLIHAAALSNLDYCEVNKDEAFHVNATATEIFAELSVQYNYRLIYISTDMVFDGKAANRCETDKVNPVNIYGKSKLTGERFIQAVCKDYVIARSALVYGRPGEFASSFSEKMLEVLSGNEVMRLFTDQYRTPILVQDLAGALLELSSNEFRGVIHLGGSQRVDRYTFGKRLAVLKNFDLSLLKPIKMSEMIFAAVRPADVSFNTDLATRVLSQPLRGYFEGLSEI